ncbi:FAD-dependent monooxygenase [Marinitenerispora sediminis]|uniref:FAD-dependent oxidoreductase n=1 Tax=Marinitenerispora sediminis TaxID=1931232 RepID=A0A368T9A6_9ACTN|nr:FAD-dependent monooxygenase [Marinitenerispora sediminis]RCV52065.1 FAD-dependent oxidoreductase [Marinitenerispora sediminis]RCV58084.1 FAD-dependent oxidoreductase [Marinitenerispora sediminis]RCV60854.1 FAD-dependent oxidoreductase [Marinitenerispora sediminis]
MRDTGRKPRALVVGLGIAGTAAALRLRQIGWEPVVVERAPARRAGGYFVGVFATGVATAGRLGVLEKIGDRSSPEAVAYEVDRAGNRSKGIQYGELPGNPRTALRGDIEGALFQALPEDLEVRYSTVPVHIAQDADAAHVTLRDTAAGTETTEDFDLVVGADGMRSTVRRLVFGPDANHLHALNYMIAVSLMSEQVPGFRPQDGLTLAEPGRSAWVFAFTNHAPSLLFSWRTEDIDAEFTRAPIDSVRAAYGPQAPGPILGHLMTQFEQAEDFLFDSVHQVRMKQWHHNRVVLLGDAAWCLTLYSGMGASTAMAGADLLGTMLQRHSGDLPRALDAWQKRLSPFISHQLRSGVQMRQLFTPQDRAQQLQRSVFMRLRNAPLIGPVLKKQMSNSKDFKMKTVDIAAP